MKHNEKQSLFSLSKAYAPAFLWALFIFILSSQSSLQGFEASAIDYFFKKGAHIFVYLVLYFLLLRATKQTNITAKQQLLIPIIVCTLYAISDEIHQSFVPGRFATLRDVGYDLLGVAIGFLKSYDYV